MSDNYSSIDRAASTQLSRCNTSLVEETAYTVEIDDDMVKDALPILTSKFLEVISNPCVTSEIKQSIFGISIPNRQKQRNSSECSNDSSSSTSLLLSRNHSAQKLQLSPTQKQHDLGYDCDNVFGQVELASRSASQVSWDTTRRFSCLIILIVITVISTLALCGIILWFWFNAEVESSMTFASSFVRVSTIDENNELLVKSFDEYRSMIQNKEIVNIKLIINIANPGDWPTGVRIPKINHVKSICVKGLFHGKKLLELLSSISSLDRLTIDNEGNSLCSETKQKIGTIQAISQPRTSVKAFAFNKFTSSCTEMLEIMHANMKLTGLETMIFTNGELNENNIIVFEKLVFQHKRSLKQLEILNTTTNATLFKQPNFQFISNVNKLVLDVYGLPVVLSKSLKNICPMLPNIEQLSLGNGLHQWKDIPNVFNCHNLKSIHLSISIPVSNDNFSLEFLSDAYPRLQSADIILIYGDHFQKTRCNEKKIILGSQKLSDGLLLNTRITSNCELTFP